MGKSKGGFYAVKAGRTPGIYNTWDDCEAEIRHFANAKFKKFDTLAAANEFLGISNPSTTTATPVASTSSASPRKSRVDRTAKPYDIPSSSSPKKKNAYGERAPDIVDESGWEVVYTDGACQGNGGPKARGGIGVWYGNNDPRNISERLPGEQTNNRAELIALIRALEETPLSKRPMLLKTDSSYSISCICNWLPNWTRNGYRTSNGGPVKNIAVILFLENLLNARCLNGQRVQLQYIKGHAGHAGNEGADALATQGTYLPTLPDRDWTIKEPTPPSTQRFEVQADASMPLAPEEAFEEDEDLSVFADMNEEEWTKLTADLTLEAKKGKGKAVAPLPTPPSAPSAARSAPRAPAPAPIPPPAPAPFVVEEEDFGDMLLDDEELARMAREQDF
ncbi:RnaseH-domain-containing protein [Sistotremastrum suecicum HHB10207 ss-3]|uniref:Ribonuclease H n=1 Tax=Sistotremastrum suecicum HHB10207 ss-3 TaxID=1314776 RepID=A0A166F4S3_9AGAM|nr:RnaseH-domain-containing protein [Sistotremastrum suecicum HHB10207 ss-3]